MKTLSAALVVVILWLGVLSGFGYVWIQRVVAVENTSGVLVLNEGLLRARLFVDEQRISQDRTAINRARAREKNLDMVIIKMVQILTTDAPDTKPSKYNQTSMSCEQLFGATDCFNAHLRTR